MALDKALLKASIITEAQGLNFDTTSEYSKIPELAEAIANAVIDHFEENGDVVVDIGTGEGTIT